MAGLMPTVDTIVVKTVCPWCMGSGRRRDGHGDCDTCYGPGYIERPVGMHVINGMIDALEKRRPPFPPYLDELRSLTVLGEQ